MSATGLCKHNNILNYCPNCSKELGMYHHGMNGYGMNGYSCMNGTMGAAKCPEGFYELKVGGIATGQCLPTSATLAKGAQAGAVGVVGTGTAVSPSTQAAVQSLAAQTLGDRIIKFYREKPAIAWGSTAAVVALVVRGGMSFIRGR
jgi:hypothetical protein